IHTTAECTEPSALRVEITAQLGAPSSVRTPSSFREAMSGNIPGGRCTTRRLPFAAPAARKGLRSMASRMSLEMESEEGFDEVLSPNALQFVSELHSEFEERRQELLAAREERRARLAEGEMLDFLPETADVRAGDWTVAPAPEALQQRWVEITGPTDRK